MNKPTYEEIINHAKMNSDCGEHMSPAEIKELVLACEAQVKQLAAENGALKAAFTPEEISTGATDVFSDTAILKIDGDEFHSSQWVDNENDVIRAVLDFFKPETPATDAILDSLRAEGIEQWIASREGRWNGTTKEAEKFAAQLRSKSEVQS